MRKGISQLIVWAFVIFAGGMMLLLFVLLANAQAEAGQQKLEALALQEVDTILATQQAASDTATTVPVPGAAIELTCEVIDGFVLSELRVGGSRSGLTNDLLAGKSLQTDRLTLFSKELRLPFDIGNLLMLTSAQEILIISHDDMTDWEDPTGTAEAFKNEFPDELQESIFYLAEQDMAGTQYDTVRIVHFGDISELTVTPNTLEADIIHVTAGDGVNYLDHGTVKFYRNTPTGPVESPPGQEPLIYSTPEMLIGYVWQADHAAAECLEAKINKKLNRHADLHIKRISLLQNQYSEPERNNRACFLRLTTTNLQSLRQADLIEPGELTSADLKAMTERVKNQNEQLVTGVRCATIY